MRVSSPRSCSCQQVVHCAKVQQQTLFMTVASPKPHKQEHKGGAPGEHVYMTIFDSIRSEETLSFHTVQLTHQWNL